MHATDRQHVAVPDIQPSDRRRTARLGGPPRVYLELASSLLAQEVSDAEGAASVPDAAERACQKLLDRLAKLITASGCHALLARALRLAQADFQFLQGIQPGPTAGTYIAGLRQSADDTDPGQVQRALTALLGTLIELVALFIGDYLTRRLLSEIWPNLPALEAIQPLRTVS